VKDLLHDPTWVWHNFTRGNHFILMDAYMDFRSGSPKHPDPKWNTTRDAWARRLSEQLDFLLERRPVARNYASGEAGHWHRLGPWLARVTDGSIVLTSDGGAANFSGIELWKLNEIPGKKTE
jgi:hypothetical protein